MGDVLPVVSSGWNRGNGSFADGTGVEARFGEPSGIAVGADGILFASDGKNQRIRKVSP